MLGRIDFQPHQVCRWTSAQRFELDGRPVHVVGTNYVARYVCTNFWEDWRPDVIASDLDAIAAAGLNSVRIPIHWEYAEPAPGCFRAEMEQRLGEFLSMAEERGIFVMPWFLVGVATQSYDVSWRDGRSVFREPMRTLAAEHLRHWVHLFKDRPNILCWDICDEPEFYSQFSGNDKLPYEHGLVEAWVDRIAQAIREEDPAHTITLGFGHLVSGDYGMSVRDMTGLLDVMCTTAYPAWIGRELLTSLRNSHFLGWSDRMNDPLGKGVFTAEAPGYSDVAASEETIAGFYRQALHCNLANGSTAVMPWVWNDFDRETHESVPIEEAVLETSFGIARADGSLKPAGRALADFAAWTEAVDILSWKPLRADVSIVVTEEYVRRIGTLWEVMFNSYLLARQAGLFPRFIWERDLEVRDNGLIVVPAQPHLRTSTWYKLQESVRRGATLLCCYAGQLAYAWRELFGVVAVGAETSRLGSMPLPGGLGALTMPGGLGKLTLELAGAEAVCRSEDGQFWLTANCYGCGQALLLNYPLEAAMAQMPQAEFEAFSGFRLYSWAATRAGLVVPAAAEEPTTEVACFEKGGDLLLVVINHSSIAHRTRVRLAAPANVAESSLPVVAAGDGGTELLLDLAPATAGRLLLQRR